VTVFLGIKKQVVARILKLMALAADASSKSDSSAWHYHPNQLPISRDDPSAVSRISEQFGDTVE
jgi:hypothetical protein